MILKIIKPIKISLLLSLIIVLGGIIRIYNLSNVPAGFFCDEASIGYNAYTILTEGKDEFGNSHPIFFKAFGEYKNPIEIYSTVPFIKIFGLNIFSVRLVSALYGIISIISIYFLTKELFYFSKSKYIISITSAFLLSISPWAIQFSRVSIEGLSPFVLFTILATFFYLKFFRKSFYLVISAIFFALALYSYFPARIFIPLFVLTITLINYKNHFKHIKTTLISLIIGIILSLSLILEMTNPNGWARWKQVSVFNNPPRQESVIIHIVNNYISNMSPNFLFFKGDIGMPGHFITRESIKNMGEIYLVQSVFILIGLFFLFTKSDKISKVIIFSWLFIYPLSSAFTTDQTVQATHSIIGVVPWQILTALGLVQITEWFNKKYLKFIILLLFYTILLVSFIFFIKNYFIEYPLYSSDYWGWQYGPEKIISYFVSQHNKYDNLYMSNEFNAPYIFIKFFDPTNKCNSKCKIVEFNENKNIINKNKKELFALSPTQLTEQNIKNSQYIIKKTIFYPNQKPAFYIIEFK